jgi:hypothetical protein
VVLLVLLLRVLTLLSAADIPALLFLVVHLVLLLRAPILLLLRTQFLPLDHCLLWLRRIRVSSG